MFKGWNTDEGGYAKLDTDMLASMCVCLVILLVVIVVGGIWL